jgi:acetylornithine deacetylase/succinyl-diaminopimelate desuccinylase-like protein
MTRKSVDRADGLFPVLGMALGRGRFGCGRLIAKAGPFRTSGSSTEAPHSILSSGCGKLADAFEALRGRGRNRVKIRMAVATAVIFAVFALSCGTGLRAQDAHNPSGNAARVVQQVREYRVAHEGAIVRELTEFLSIPNVASDEVNIQKNAARLVEMLKARGVETELLPIAGRGPVVFGKLVTPGAKRTVIFYAHYDGQPVDAAAWTDGKPFEPVLRDNSIEAGGKRIPFPSDAGAGGAAGAAEGAYKDDWRIYARSASDDKSPIVAILAAIDALRAQKIPLGVNVKMIFEGEEEAGSTNLERTLQAHKDLLGADLLLTCDGPVHPSGKPLIFFGARGDVALDVTVYGPVRALHSGHYGNWAPNPAMELSRLLASMTDANGRVLIPNYYDDVVPLSALEKEWLAKMPDNDAELASSLGIAKPDGGGKKLAELLQQPSLNIRGLNSAYVGTHAQNVVPDKAEASIDARLVKGEDPRKKSEQIVGYIRAQGYFVVDHEPTMDERRAHALIAKIVDEGGYRASRTAMDLPVSKAMIALVQSATDGRAVIAPGLGGSVPMYIFEDVGLPWIGVPIVNYDNHQHSSDENLRLGHFWKGMEMYGAVLAGLDW